MFQKGELSYISGGISEVQKANIFCISPKRVMNKLLEWKLYFSKNTLR